MFSYLSKVLFSGFLQLKGNFVDGQNNSKYRGVAPLKKLSPLFDPVRSKPKALGNSLARVFPRFAGVSYKCFTLTFD